MDKLKLYAAPLIALVLLLAWIFVIKPMLDEGASEAGAPAGERGPEGGAEPAAPQR